MLVKDTFILLHRTLGMGSCVFWARVGGVIAPQILLLVRNYKRVNKCCLLYCHSLEHICQLSSNFFNFYFHI